MNETLGQLIVTTLNTEYPCEACGENHRPDIGCDNLTDEGVKARRWGAIAQTIIQYIKDNPSSIS